MSAESGNPSFTREEVLDVLKRNLLEAVDGLTEEKIASAKSFTDLGADSLAVIDVITGATRELNVRVSRTDLALVKDLDGLIELLRNAKPASSPASG